MLRQHGFLRSGELSLEGRVDPNWPKHLPDDYADSVVNPVNAAEHRGDGGADRNDEDGEDSSKGAEEGSRNRGQEVLEKAEDSERQLLFLLRGRLLRLLKGAQQS